MYANKIAFHQIEIKLFVFLHWRALQIAKVNQGNLFTQKR